MSIVKVEGLNKTFADYRALAGVGFEFEHGILSILGPSGCGKTTLLRCIAGLEVPDDGAIWIDGKVQTDINKGILVPPYSREIGFVFQNYALWPHMTVYNNVAFGLKLRKVKDADVRRPVPPLAAPRGLADAGDRFPRAAPGGAEAAGRAGGDPREGAAVYPARGA